MIKLAKIFQDGMTFQRNKPCKVWGTSSEEKTVTIYMNEKEVAERELPQGDFAGQVIRLNLTRSCIIFPSPWDTGASNLLCTIIQSPPVSLISC